MKKLFFLYVLIINVCSVQLTSAKGKKPQTSSEVIVQEFSATKLSKELIPAKKKHSLLKKSPLKQDDKVIGQKSQIIALILVIFVGNFGIHNFYLNRKERGITQLLLIIGGSIVFQLAALLGLLFPAAIALILVLAGSIWIFIDFINIITGKLKPKNGEYTDAF